MSRDRHDGAVIQLGPAIEPRPESSHRVTAGEAPLDGLRRAAAGIDWERSAAGVDLP